MNSKTLLRLNRILTSNFTDSINSTTETWLSLGNMRLCYSNLIDLQNLINNLSGFSNTDGYISSSTTYDVTKKDDESWNGKLIITGTNLYVEDDSGSTIFNWDNYDSSAIEYNESDKEISVTYNSTLYNYKINKVDSKCSYTIGEDWFLDASDKELLTEIPIFREYPKLLSGDYVNEGDPCKETLFSTLLIAVSVLNNNVNEYNTYSDLYSILGAYGFGMTYDYKFNSYGLPYINTSYIHPTSFQKVYYTSANIYDSLITHSEYDELSSFLYEECKFYYLDNIENPYDYINKWCSYYTDEYFESIGYWDNNYCNYLHKITITDDLEDADYLSVYNLSEKTLFKYTYTGGYDENLDLSSYDETTGHYGRAKIDLDIIDNIIDVLNEGLNNYIAHGGSVYIENSIVNKNKLNNLTILSFNLDFYCNGIVPNNPSKTYLTNRDGFEPDDNLSGDIFYGGGKYLHKYLVTLIFKENKIYQAIIMNRYNSSIEKYSIDYKYNDDITFNDINENYTESANLPVFGIKKLTNYESNS